MSADPARDLIEELSADLVAVRPMAPIASTFALMLAAAGVVTLAVVLGYGARPDLLAECLRNTTYACVLVGLAFAVIGGFVATLASVAPGRELVLRVAGGLAVAGLSLCVVAAAVATPWREAALAPPMSGHLACIARGMIFAIAPAAVGLLFASRGWSGRPALTVALALSSAGATGALLVHMTCPAVDPLHQLSTHTSTPFLVAALLTAAFAPAMRRWAR
jgi:hypothetical protein